MLSPESQESFEWNFSHPPISPSPLLPISPPPHLPCPSLRTQHSGLSVVLAFITTGIYWDTVFPVTMMAAQFSRQPMPQISVEELAKRLADTPEGLQLVDVREPEEVAIAQLDGFKNLPLSEFAEWSGDIQTRFDPDAETLVLCHHGIRSAQMCQWLIAQGFTNVKNIAGGIDAYSILIDPTVPRY